MKKKHEPKPHPAPPKATEPVPGPPVAELGESADAMEGPAVSGSEDLQRLEGQIQDLERQVVEWKDRALRAAADLDNYRRRAIRERDEALARGQGEVLIRIIEVVDDLARVAHLDPAATTSQALHEGMLAIERKFQRVLEASGVERIDPTGVPFDPTAHEAMTVMPAPGPEADGTVGTVFQPGYRLNGTLIRAARVAVLKWTEPGPADVAN